MHSSFYRILRKFQVCSANMLWPPPMTTIKASAMLRRLSTFAPYVERTLPQVTLAAKKDLSGLLVERSASYNSVEASVDGSIASIKLSRPKTQNAFNMPMWNEVYDAFWCASADPDVRVVILSGAGGNFSSGMDLAVFQEMKALAAAEACEGRKREQVFRSIEFFQRSISAPEMCSKPVLCAIEGNVIGAGVDLITACDLRFCTKDAKLSVKEVDLGIVADVGTMQRLPNLVGDQRARELTYTGRAFSGVEAVSYGLCLESFASAEQMMDHVQSVAVTIAAKSPLTIRGIKRTSLYTRDHPTVDALNQVFTHHALTALTRT